MDSPFSPFPQSSQSVTGLPPVQQPATARPLPSSQAQSPLHAQFPAYGQQSSAPIEPTSPAQRDQVYGQELNALGTTPASVQPAPTTTQFPRPQAPFTPAAPVTDIWNAVPESPTTPPSFSRLQPAAQPLVTPGANTFSSSPMQFGQDVRNELSQPLSAPTQPMGPQAFQHPWEQPQATQPLPQVPVAQPAVQPLPVAPMAQPLAPIQPQMPVMQPTAQPLPADPFAVSAPQPIQTPLKPEPVQPESSALFSQTAPSIDQRPPAPQLSPETVHQAILSEIEQEELFGRERLSPWQKVVIVTIAILTLAIIAGAGVWVYITVTAPAAQNAPIAGKDTDGDGLSDNEERNYGTDPSKKDTDGDGYSDFEEIKNGYSPLGK